MDLPEFEDWEFALIGPELHDAHIRDDTGFLHAGHVWMWERQMLPADVREELGI